MPSSVPGAAWQGLGQRESLADLQLQAASLVYYHFSMCAIPEKVGKLGSVVPLSLSVAALCSGGLEDLFIELKSVSLLIQPESTACPLTPHRRLQRCLLPRDKHCYHLPDAYSFQLTLNTTIFTEYSVKVPDIYPH